MEPEGMLFDRFWAAYPRKTAKADARKAWRQIAADDALVDRMLQTLAWQKKDPGWVRDHGAYVPYPGSWLRGMRWEDEPFEPETSLAVAQRPVTREQARVANNRDVFARALARDPARSAS